MAEETAYENGWISNFQGRQLMKMAGFPTFKGLWSCDLDLGSGHTAHRRASLIVVSTSTYMPNFTEIAKLCEWTAHVHTYRVKTFETHFIRSTQKSRPKGC